jgi:uncharacterized protein (DUF433 family)
MTETKQNNIHATLGEGIYLVKDVAKILHLDYEHVRRWILGYWDGHLSDNTNYVFGDKGNKAINFYSLIEFYTFYKLREQGLSPDKIRKIRTYISEELNTPYPFAKPVEFYVENRKNKKGEIIKRLGWYEYFNTLVKGDGKHQISLSFVKPFLKKIEFSNGIAARYFPLDNSKNVVVDPKHQFGQPTITGTNIKTQTLFNLYKGGESYENISILYDLSIEKVKDAICFQNAA